MSNAIVWTAKADVPEKGIGAEPLTIEKLQENQDEKIPAKFSVENIQKTFQLKSEAKGTTSTTPAAKGRQLYASPILRGNSKQRVSHSVDIRGVKKLLLVVGDAGDGFSCDWADWIQPTLIGTDKKMPLTQLTWRQASASWGEVRKNANADGGPMVVQGETIKDGIGTHADSMIEYEIPEGFEKLDFQCGLDLGGVSQNGGQTTSVQFFVYAEAIPEGKSDRPAPSAQASRQPENAVAGLKLHPEVEATLAASEPTLKSLTNLDIDDRGRIWVCEVVNYRRHNGERPEGDRILILEDTNQDGIADTSKVFYQGRDIDSAMGICVLGNKVIVSAAPYVWQFTDSNGDDIPDKKEAIFTKTGQPQHDHSNHSFVFGPDGKLYWNFGNTGKAIFDGAGNPVMDRWNRPINDSGKTLSPRDGFSLQS